MTPRRINFLLLLVAFVLFPPLLARYTPGFFSELRFLVLGGGLALAAAAIALNLLMGYAGQISLGHAALLGVGAFTSAIVTGRGPELPLPFGVIAAALVTGVFAFLLGLPALRLRGLYLAIVTISFGLTMEQSLLRWKPVTGGSAGVETTRFLTPGFELKENADYVVVVLLLLVAIWIVDRNVVRTKLGRAFKAIREDEAVAQSFGIDVARYKLTAFVLSGVMAGVAGAMLAHLVGVVSSESFPYRLSLLLVVVVVVGGLGSRAGAIVAALFFVFLPRLFELPSLSFLSGWDQVLGAGLLIYTMARHPGGLAGAFREAREKKLGEAPSQTVTIPKLPALPRPAGVAERRLEGDRPVLELKNISVSFGGLKAVDEASLEVTSGKIVGLIGPNGAGKTTLFNAISGFVSHQGAISLFGEEIQDLPPHARARLGLGRTFQLIGLERTLSVLENFLLAQHSIAGYGLGPALAYLPSAARVERDLTERAMKAIETLGFERFTNTPVRNLSHGQQRLVELGCALVTAPDLLLLDEPSSGMAPGAVENLALRLKDIRDELGRTVLLIEHNIPLVLDVCDYIYVLNFGRLLASGTTEEIAAHPEVIAAYFGEAEEVAVG